MKKKTKILIIVSVCLVVCAVVCLFAANNILYGPIKAKEPVSITTSCIEDISDVKLIGHRGFSAIAPENTLEAFEEACENGFYGCELDVHLTVDNIWVVMHDSNIKKMTGKKGKIEKKTFDELRSVEITNGANIDKYYGIRIPSLEETLALLRRYDISPVIEIKTATDNVKGIYDLIRKYDLVDKTWIISFEKEPLIKLRKLSEKIKISYLVNEVKQEDVDFCVENRLNGIDFDRKKTGEEGVKMILDAELIPQVWTVDKIEDLEKFYSYGVRYFTGNCITY